MIKIINKANITNLSNARIIKNNKITENKKETKYLIIIELKTKNKN